MRLSSLVMVLLVPCALPARAQEQPSVPAVRPGDQAHDPLFVGYQTEPVMDFGGRTVASLQDAASRGIGSIGQLGVKHPGWAPAWEFPVAIVLQVLQHEVMGHGGRAWEFGLSS